jgi:hypothetical protein
MSGNCCIRTISRVGNVVGKAFTSTSKRVGDVVVDTSKTVGTAVADTSKKAGTVIADNTRKGFASIMNRPQNGYQRLVDDSGKKVMTGNQGSLARNVDDTVGILRKGDDAVNSGSRLVRQNEQALTKIIGPIPVGRYLSDSVLDFHQTLSVQRSALLGNPMSPKLKEITNMLDDVAVTTPEDHILQQMLATVTKRMQHGVSIERDTVYVNNLFSYLTKLKVQQMTARSSPINIRRSLTNFGHVFRRRILSKHSRGYPASKTAYDFQKILDDAEDISDDQVLGTMLEKGMKNLRITDDLLLEERKVMDEISSQLRQMHLTNTYEKVMKNL